MSCVTVVSRTGARSEGALTLFLRCKYLQTNTQNKKMNTPLDEVKAFDDWKNNVDGNERKNERNNSIAVNNKDLVRLTEKEESLIRKFTTKSKYAPTAIKLSTKS